MYIISSFPGTENQSNLVICEIPQTINSLLQNHFNFKYELLNLKVLTSNVVVITRPSTTSSDSTTKLNSGSIQIDVVSPFKRMIIDDFGFPPRAFRAERPSPNDEESARVSRKRKHSESLSEYADPAADSDIDADSELDALLCSHAFTSAPPSILASGHSPARVPPVLVCFGDSFLKPFSYGFRDSHVRALSISGATARSLGNLESRSGSNRLITQLLTDVHSCDLARFSHCRAPTVPMLLMCGHVDLYFNLYQKMFDEHSLDARAYLRESVERYVAFLATLHARWPRLSTVYGALRSCRLCRRRMCSRASCTTS